MYDDIKSWSKVILSAFQPNHNAGILPYIASNDSANLTSISYWINYINVLFNSSPTFIVIISIHLILAVWLTIFTLVWLFWRLKCKNDHCTATFCKSGEIKPNTSEILLLNSLQCSSSKNLDEEKTIPHGHQFSILTFWLAFIFGLLAVIAFILFFTATNELRLKFQNKNNQSLQFSLNSALDSIEMFFDTFIHQGVHAINDTALRLDTQFADVLGFAVSKLAQELMSDFKILKIFETSRNTLSKVFSILDTMKEINEKKKIFDSILEFKGFIDGVRVHELRKFLPKLCSLNDLKNLEKCNILLHDSDNLVININQKQINFDTISTVPVLVELLKMNISSFADVITNSNTKIDKQIENIKKPIIKQFSIKTIFNSVHKTWLELTPLLQTMIRSINNIRYQKYIEKNLNKSLWLWIILISIVFAILLIMFCLMVMILIYTAILLEIFKNCFIKNKVESYPKASKIKNIRVLQNILIYPSFNIHYAFLSLTGVLFIVPSILQFCLFFMGLILNNEICRHASSPMTASVSDQYIYSILSQNWEPWISTFMLTNKNAAIQLDLKVPKNVMTSLQYTCNNNYSVGLIGALGMSGVVNVSAILESQLVTNIIISGKKFAIQALYDMDIASQIPSLDAQIISAADISRLILDNIDYNPSIKELGKNILVINNYTAYVIALQSFVNGLMAQSIYPAVETLHLNETASKMQLSLSNYALYFTEIKHLQNLFLKLQLMQNLSVDLLKILTVINESKQLVLDKDKVTKAISQRYDEVIKLVLLNISDMLTKQMSYLEDNLIKCNKLSEAFHHIFNGFCVIVLDNVNISWVTFIFALQMYCVVFIFCWIFMFKIRNLQLFLLKNNCNC